MTTRTTDFWKLFKPVHCNIKLEASTKEGVLEELVDTLVKSNALDEPMAPAALKALTDRERTASTGIGMNVAIPHVKIAGLQRVVASLSRHPDGVEWSALDGEPVQLFFTVLRPAEPTTDYDPDRHLAMMGWISRLCRDADFRRFAIRAKTRKELVDLLKEMAGL